MFSAGLISVSYGAIVLIGALANFIRFRELSTLLLEVAVGAVLLTTGWRAWREPGSASFGAAVITFLSAIFFAYRFLQSGQLVPALMLLAGFVAFSVALLGVFLDARRDT